MQITVSLLSEEDILSIAERAFGKKPQWFAFMAMPKTHTCVTYREHDTDFYGADHIALRKNYDLEVRIFYREDMLPADRQAELVFEDAVRNAGTFAKDTGYNADEKMFYTLYTFNIDEEF